MRRAEGRTLALGGTDFLPRGVPAWQARCVPRGLPPESVPGDKQLSLCVPHYDSAEHEI